MRRKYRSVAGIMLDILECLEEPEVLTKVATCANLPYDRAKGIVERMIEKGYLRKRSDGKLEVTSEGRKALKKLKELKDMMEALGFKL
ncbi:hypothetical protein IPA_02875 [Ignicoccus pacificus DSM 13166]|uniref:ArnR1-like winged helix-turn-helix domain-containing protein n=1 Tax=Ignicoccus pacificus DSM 13166 TaxID=940294 RepID=A0A977PKP9_9CREN|nr:hypothetical protein IPA_02875 [Ignicoccus pacificus DSM 13166]